MGSSPSGTRLSRDPRRCQASWPKSWSSAGSNAYSLNGGNGDYITDPIYVWHNSGPGISGTWFKDWANNTSWGSAPTYFVAGRDYSNVVKTAYTPLGTNPYVLP